MLYGHSLQTLFVVYSSSPCNSLGRVAWLMSTKTLTDKVLVCLSL